VTSYFQRYLAGEHEAVWAELRAAGSISDALTADCAAVATETMRRVRRHVDRLAEQLTELGLRSQPLAPFRSPPTESDVARLDELAAAIGGLPFALDACLRHVGRVWFAGDCVALGLYYEDDVPPGVEQVLADPLVLADVDYLSFSWAELLEIRAEEPDAGLLFELAPDELHKAAFSGGTHDIPLPQRVADPVLLGVLDRPGITLVEYLRLSIAWGGLPGWATAPDRVPPALTKLRAEPDF